MHWFIYHAAGYILCIPRATIFLFLYIYSFPIFPFVYYIYIPIIHIYICSTYIIPILFIIFKAFGIVTRSICQISVSTKYFS